jgi:AGCS family alanine or glycine:cation symporter
LLISNIFEGAFSGLAATGGVAGYAIKEAFVTGVRRACFSNEAGLGSAAIAHSAAATKEPVREGVVALLEPFIDTVIICTITALVVGASGLYHEDMSGVQLTASAFDVGIPGFGTYFIPIAVFLFAYSTLISWSYYGERAIDYLFGEKGLMPYRIAYCIFAFVGAIWAIGPVLNFSDIMLALMAVPNLIGVLILLPLLRKSTAEYRKKLKANSFE